MRALLVVDIQNDFVPGGALEAPGGDQVIPVANRLIPRYELVVASQDWHPPNHMSFASQHPGHQVGDVIELDGLEQILWPDHCVQGTVGAEFCQGLNLDGVDKVIRKGTDPNIDSYSAFFDNGHRKSTGLERFLRDRGVDELHLAGLTAEFCVRFTALDARRLGFAVKVFREGVRGVERNPGDCERALAEMRAAGVEIISAGE